MACWPPPAIDPKRTCLTLGSAAKGLSQFAGPSLLVYNNAEFSDEDFKSITRIGDSGKQLARTKVGRFGVGFNSVYHLTDVPAFVSGHHVVFFDPHLRHLSQSRGAEPGRRIKFTPREGQKLLAEHPDTFAPFQAAFGLDFRRKFPGTLFRFPLRTPEQAEGSEISKVVYDEGKMKQVLEAFQSSAAEASARSIAVA